MHYLEYRKMLGIETDDLKIVEMLKNRIDTFFNVLYEEYFKNSSTNYDPIIYNYFIAVGEKRKSIYFLVSDISSNIVKENTVEAIVCKFVIFINSINNVRSGLKNRCVSFLEDSLKELHISYDTVNDEDGVFYFLSGAEELDEGLVKKPFEWLQKYPHVRKQMTEALKMYTETDNYSQVADQFRKTLESFFKSFFNNDKSLENNRSIYGKYLKEKGVPSQISNNFEVLLKLYTSFNNEYAKHNQNTQKNVVESIMYLTGIIMRLLITLKDS